MSTPAINVSPEEAPVTEAEFLSQLPGWSAGSLDDAAIAAMEQYVNSNPHAADLADAEREFDARVRDALLVGVDAEQTVAALLAQARPSVPPAQAQATALSHVRPRPARVLLFVRAAAAVAASLLIAFSMGWFYCIGPFECPLIEALEKAAVADAVATTPRNFSAIEHPDRAEPQGELEVVDVDYGTSATAVRARYQVAGKDLTVLWASTGEQRPSMRRRVVIKGQEWWIAEENGQRVVLFQDGRSGRLCCLVSETTEKELLAIADRLRRGEP